MVPSTGWEFRLVLPRGRIGAPWHRRAGRIHNLLLAARWNLLIKRYRAYATSSVSRFDANTCTYNRVTNRVEFRACNQTAVPTCPPAAIALKQLERSVPATRDRDRCLWCIEFTREQQDNGKVVDARASTANYTNHRDSCTTSRNSGDNGRPRSRGFDATPVIHDSLFRLPLRCTGLIRVERDRAWFTLLFFFLEFGNKRGNRRGYDCDFYKFNFPFFLINDTQGE